MVTLLILTCWTSNTQTDHKITKHSWSLNTERWRATQCQGHTHTHTDRKTANPDRSTKRFMDKMHSNEKEMVGYLEDLPGILATSKKDCATQQCLETIDNIFVWMSSSLIKVKTLVAFGHMTTHTARHTNTHGNKHNSHPGRQLHNDKVTP